MTASLNRRAKLLALVGTLAALAVSLISGPTAAQASTSEYCGGWKSPGQECSGAARWVYQTYGWGDQASVCVGIGGWTGVSCSSGAGAGVYSGQMSSNVYSWLYMKNNSSINNYVHGVALTH
jgi:hypothetical protein